MKTQNPNLKMKNNNLKLKIVLFFLIILFGILGLPKISLAAIINALSCSSIDVQSAINLASPGDTVIVPPGNCTWSTQVNVNKNIILKGNLGSTITIAVGINASADNFRITGFNFVLGGAGTIIWVDQNTSQPQGLIDNNTFTTAGGGELIFVRNSTDTWKLDSPSGNQYNLYIENNIFTNTGAQGSEHCVNANYNANVVFRYNDVTNMNFDAHGVWSNGYGSQNSYAAGRCDWSRAANRSARWYEIYNNYFTSGKYTNSINLRGGTGVVFNNVITAGPGSDGIIFQEYCTGVGADGNCCPGSETIPRCNCIADYPLHYQIGRGRNETLEPLYLWNNVANGNQVVGYSYGGPLPQTIVGENFPNETCIAACGGPVPGYRYGGTWTDFSGIIQENRDYYITQKPGYIPYTCPHPLTGLTGSCDPTIAGRNGYNIAPPDTTPPAAPKNLTIL